MDFIVRLPKSNGMTIIFVVCDRYTKYAHFIPLAYPFGAAKIGEVFMDTIVRLHGWPSEIISDRDNIFMSAFWSELMQQHEVKLLKSTAFHPQSDGQTEALNKTIEGYLRCVTGELPKKWTKYIALAELWYNTKFHIAIKMTPFEALYGYPPPMPNITVTYTVKTRQQIKKLLQDNLTKAQERMKKYVDLKRVDKEFNCGDFVYLKIQPY